MRLEDMRRSENVEDRRGLTAGRAGAGIGSARSCCWSLGTFWGSVPAPY